MYKTFFSDGNILRSGAVPDSPEVDCDGGDAGGGAAGGDPRQHGVRAVPGGAVRGAHHHGRRAPRGSAAASHALTAQSFYFVSAGGLLGLLLPNTTKQALE